MKYFSWRNLNVQKITNSLLPGRCREPDSERPVAGGSIRGPDEAGDVRERRDGQDLVHDERLRRHAQEKRSTRIPEVVKLFFLLK